jgi:hypothetical protein
MVITVKTPRSSKKERAELKRLGFFHATGLPWITVHEEEETGNIQANKQHLGCWGFDGQWAVAVLKNGEVWLRKNCELPDEHRKVLNQLCPHGRSAPIPSTNHRIIAADNVAERVSDPNSFCDGYADPEPKPV